jgi:von Willebrand factor type A domain
MTFLTPAAALVALAALLPVAAWLAARRRVEAVRRGLRLPAPERRAAFVRPALGVAGVALLGLAAAQPALTHTTRPRVLRDVQAVFVVDTSRSMAASASPASPTRLDRAVAAAVRLRQAIPQVEAGVLTLTDRVLPDLLPVPDRSAFAAVVQRAVRIESPPPRSASVRATRYTALVNVAEGNVFAPRATRRIVVLLTDGESTPVDTGDLSRALSASRGYRFAAVRFWSAGESVFDADGEAEAAYRPDPTGATTLRDTADAVGGRSFDEGDLGAAVSYVRGLAGGGPTVRAAGTTRTRETLAPYAALAGLLCLLAALAPWPPHRPGLALGRQ